MNYDSQQNIYPHRNAAIMFTDLEGSTSLMETDEDKGLVTIRQNREIHESCIKANNGKLLKELGDGFLATFEKIDDAVNCAIQIQQKARKEKLEIPIRIGLHYGDVTLEHDDIFGLGVVTASRIQTIADPGGVYLSKTIYDQLDNPLHSRVKFMGQVPLKNIRNPLPVYALTGDDLPEPNKRRIDNIIKQKARLRTYRNGVITILVAVVVGVTWFFNSYDITKPLKLKTIAVFPFEVESASMEKDELGNGFATELIYALSATKSLTVISQESTNYASLIGNTNSANMLEADYYVNGKVSMSGEKINVHIFLTSTTDSIVWNLQDSSQLSESRKLWISISQELAHQMGVFIPLANSRIWAGTREVDPETYKLYIKGISALSTYPPDVPKGIESLNKAIELNPVDPLAYAWLAQGYIFLGHSPGAKKDDRNKAMAAAMRALQLDSTLAEGWSALATIKTYYEWDWIGAEQAFNRANELNPSLPWNHYHYAWYLALFGRMDEAIREHKLAQQLDPFISLHTAWLGELYRIVDEYDKAIFECNASMKLEDSLLGSWVLSDTYANMGRIDEATKRFEANTKLWIWLKYFELAPFYARVGRQEEAKVILEELENKFDSIPTGFGALSRVRIYAALGDYDNAFRWMGYRPHHAWLPWLRIDNDWVDNSFKSDPRFEKNMNDMHLSPSLKIRYNPEENLD